MRRKRIVTDPKRAVAYLRVSTDEQSLGPEAQRRAIEGWCQRNGMELIAVHEDQGLCGALDLDKRPGLAAALDDLTRLGAGVLVAAKRDRLARDTFVMGMIERLAERVGARVRTADGAGDGDGPEAQLMRSMIDAFAQFERALIRTRTKSAMAVKKSRRERVGSVGYGWRLAADGRHLEPDPKEQKIVATAQELREKGFTLARIGKELSKRRMRSRNGTKSWHPQTVQNLLRAELARQ